MAGLAEAVQQAVGQPASIRVGIVESLDPLTVSVQGVILNDVGVLSSYAPQIGDSVVVIGQSSEAGSDPASWVALGSATPAGLRVRQALASSSVNLGAESALPGTQIRFTTTAPVTLIQAQWTADLNVIGATASTAVVRPSLNGVVQATIQAILEMPVAAAIGRWTLGNQALYTVGPGDHLIELSGAANNAAQIQTVANSTNLMVTIYG